MPNTFGSTTAAYPLISPTSIIQDRSRFRRQSIPELQYANSYYSLSNQSDIGWLLLDRRSYDLLDKYSTSLQLKIQDFVNPTLTISNLSIVQARCVTRGIASDPNAIYLIQVTDNLGVLSNSWFDFPVNVQYNVRSPAYPQSYYSYSMNSGSTWTWNTMLGNLWALAPSQLGSYPGLPTTPEGTPEDYIFTGQSLWEAIRNILAHLGMVIVGSYPSFSIVVLGSTDNAFTSLQTTYQQYLEDDMEYIDGGSGRVPGQMVVYFRRRNSIYGTEETVRRDSLQWQSSPAYSVTISAPTTFSTAAGTGFLWSDFTIRYDEDGVALSADVTTANTIAQERVTQFYNRIFHDTQGHMKQIYSGILPFTTGSLVDGVRWYMGPNNGRYSGWHTEIVRGCIWPEVTDRY